MTNQTQDLTLKTVFDNVLVGIIVLNEFGNIASANRVLVQLLGYDFESDLVDKPFRKYINELDLETYVNYTNHVTEAEPDNPYRKLITFEVIKKDGSHIPVEFTLTTPKVEDQTLYVGVVRSIEERKELEQEVKELEANKARIISQLDREQELNELKSRFVSMASHEFRTPLAGVLSSANLILRYLQDEQEVWNSFKHKAKVENHIGKVKESVRNLTIILNGFLSIGKLEEGKVKCVYEIFEIPQFLNHVILDLKSLCKPGQSISYDHKGQAEKAELDKSMLRNIANNLISNAIKYSSEDSCIAVSTSITQKQVILEVSDKGIGIPPKEQEQLFNRFFRAKNATNIQGTGLGLNLVKQYVDLLGGSIRFASEENKGTTFHIELPNKKP